MKKENYLVMDPDGSFRWITADRQSLLQDFYAALDSFCVECVRISSDGILCCIVDESGVLNNKRLNPLASRLYAGSAHGAYLFGSVLFVRIGLVDGDLDWLPLNDFALDYLQYRLGMPIPLAPAEDEE